MKRILAVCTTAVLTLGLTIVGAAAPASAAGQKILVCHATAADTNTVGWVALPPLDSHAIFTPGPNGHDEHAADIIPAFDDYAGKNLGTEYGWGATGAEVLANGCALPAKPPTEVTPPSASMVDECGTENDLIVIPADGTGYSFSGTGGDVYLTAAATYVFPVGTVTEWHFVLTDVPCVTPPGDTEVTPPSASMVDECGTENDRIVIPADGTGYSFSGTGGDVYLTAAADFVFPVGTVTEWHFVLTDVPCVTPPGDTEVTPPSASMVDECGTENDLIVIPANGTGYSFSGTGGDVYLTAAADYVFPAGTVTEWHFVLTDVPCVTPPGELVAPVPAFIDAECDSPAVLSLPGFDNGTWSWGGQSGASFSGEPANLEFGVPYEVTAMADEGFIIPGQTVWSFTGVEPTDCGGVDDSVIVVVPPVTMQDACGPDNEVVSMPEALEGVIFSQERSATTVTVTATAETGVVLSYGDSLTDTVTWGFTVNDEACAVIPDPPIDPPVVVPPAVVPPAVVPPAVLPAAVATARPLALASTGVEADSMGILALLLFLVGAVVFAVGRKQESISPSGETRLSSRHADHRHLSVGELWANRTHGGVRAGTEHRH